MSQIKYNKYNSNGQRHGLWKEYYYNGQLCWEGNYVNGQEHGLWKNYYYNGQPWKKGNYVNGQRHGLWKNYEKGEKQ